MASYRCDGAIKITPKISKKIFQEQLIKFEENILYHSPGGKVTNGKGILLVLKSFIKSSDKYDEIQYIYFDTIYGKENLEYFPEAILYVWGINLRERYDMKGQLFIYSKDNMESFFLSFVNANYNFFESIKTFGHHIVTYDNTKYDDEEQHWVDLEGDDVAEQEYYHENKFYNSELENQMIVKCNELIQMRKVTKKMELAKDVRGYIEEF